MTETRIFSRNRNQNRNLVWFSSGSVILTETGMGILIHAVNHIFICIESDQITAFLKLSFDEKEVKEGNACLVKTFFKYV